MTQLETRSLKPRIAKGETEQSKVLIKLIMHKDLTQRLKTALSQTALVPWSIG